MRICSFFCGMITIFFLSACASQDMTRSGYLTNYAGLQKKDEDRKEAIAVNSTANLSQYTHAMIMPVVYAGKNTSGDEGTDFQRLSQLMQRQLQDKFSKRFALTNQPAPNTLIVRAAITDVTKAKPVLNTITTVGLAAPFFNGGLSGEAELLDAVSGEQLRAITWAEEGSVWRLSQMKGSFSQLGHAEYLTGVFTDRIFAMTEASKE